MATSARELVLYETSHSPGPIGLGVGGRKESPRPQIVVGERNRRWWTSAIKRGRGERVNVRCSRPSKGGKETHISSATHPLWPRILEHVHKKAMRDIPPGAKKSRTGGLFVA